MKTLINQKIFIADDDPFTRLLIEETMTLANVNVIEAAGCELAISMFTEQSGNRDLVLLDMFNPESIHIGLLNQLFEENPGISVIALSAKDPARLIQKCKAFGLQANISRLFDAEDLVNVIRSGIILSVPSSGREKGNSVKSGKITAVYLN